MHLYYHTLNNSRWKKSTRMNSPSSHLPTVAKCATPSSTISNRATFFIVPASNTTCSSGPSALINRANMSINTDECHQTGCFCAADPLSGSNTDVKYRNTRSESTKRDPPPSGTCLTCHVLIGYECRPASNQKSPLNSRVKRRGL